jgi:sigma-B regulation protein RsbU (phosphoserine phosphatase)
MTAPSPAERRPPPTEDLEDLYENAPCGYLSMRPDGRIFMANATLASWTGLSKPQLVDKPFRELLTAGAGVFYESVSAPLLALQGRFDEVSLDLKTADGGKLPVFANAVERRDADGRLSFTRLTIFKAAERRRYERELVEARNAAEAASAKSRALESVMQNLLHVERESSKLREQFIAVLGHDLRNPLASISSGVRLLSKEPQSAQAKQLLALMQGSVSRMAALIDNVLDFARGRLGGGIDLNWERKVDLEPVLQQVVSELRIGAQEREIRTQFALREPVDCDPSRIGQLASNLLGNALTHGEDGAPVRLQAAIDAGGLTISVANSGKPIPPETRERLFQPFFRGEVRASQQGLGLGLHIASEIAKAHGGTLTVESSPAETRFTFRMPRSAKLA